MTYEENFPQEPGHYLWFMTDWGFVDVGLVHVTKDNPKHLEYLTGRFAEGCRDFFVYKTKDGQTLSMYHDAATGNELRHVPPMKDDGTPCVDGYVKIDPWTFQTSVSATPKQPFDRPATSSPIHGDPVREIPHRRE